MEFKNQREKMIKRLISQGICDQNVLNAMRKIPRHKFLSQGFWFQAYDEKALPIGREQTISHPYTVARMTELLAVKPGNKILEIGTGSGYQCAVLYEMGAQVFTIELEVALADKVKELFSELGYNVAIKVGDGTQGWAKFAPYDSIIVTAGAPDIPKILIQQLKNAGRLLIPIGLREEQTLNLLIKNNDSCEQRTYNKYQFVPLRGKLGWKVR
jgi:protein-L-isoaspartate(D-aspartate) O-methyltransferase